MEEMGQDVQSFLSSVKTKIPSGAARGRGA